MKTYLQLKSIFVFSETTKKYFSSEFGSGLNVIYGPNTAGKSTLIQLLLYAFGINDNKIKLSNILSENIFVRIDISINSSSNKNDFTLIRKDETLYIRDQNSKITIFNGISGNSSAEHIKLKNYLSKLFNFNLTLESKDELVAAPIETIFLPYYVSQDVGWVYLRKSFTNLEFYKNFKEDFLDYYLGISNNSDKKEKKRLETELYSKRQKLNFYISFEKNNDAINNAIIFNKSLENKGDEFINIVTSKKNDLLKLENDYIKLSNALTFNTQRLSVVNKVTRNNNKQFPGKDSCPTCSQTLPSTIKNIYEHFQENNDNIQLKSELSSKNKDIQSQINSLNKKITELRQEIHIESKRFLKYSDNNLTLDDFIKYKADLALNDSIKENIADITIQIDDLVTKLKDFNSDDDIYFERTKKSKIFKSYYSIYNTLLKVPKVEEDRFNNIYEMSSFPFQGVLLHLAVLSYHFAFNKIVEQTDNIHRLPFIMDSVFKEDIDGNNRRTILEFIDKHKPTDTQTIISLADTKIRDTKIEEYKREIFDSNTQYILVGDHINKESLLQNLDENFKQNILDDSYSIIESI